MKPDPVALQAERRILLIRQQRVMLGQHLAELYGVPVKVLNQAVRRNPERFPADFIFQLDRVELDNLKSQIVTSSWGGSRVAPYAFTEQGVAMLSSVLRSRRAVQVNIAIMRAFVRLRKMLLTNAELARKLADLERKYDSQFKAVFDAIASSWPAASTAQTRNRLPCQRGCCPLPLQAVPSQIPSRQSPIVNAQTQVCSP